MQANGLDLFLVNTPRAVTNTYLVVLIVARTYLAHFVISAPVVHSLSQYPYRVLPNRTGADGLIGGIIECVPNASSRDEIGKATACSLKDYFISRFGPPESAGFQKAQRNFIISCAGYAVVCHILQVKDRHNGNLMIDENGFMIHIDFG
jgi:phosphatidylinositol 4-kinase